MRRAARWETRDAAFQDAKKHVINDFIDPVLSLLGAAVKPGSALESGLNDFFHGSAHAAEVKTNLEKIKAEIARLTTAGNYACGTMNDSACAGGAIAYNNGGHVVVCPGYVPLAGTLTQAEKDDHARNLLHEAAHSTSGLVGVVVAPFIVRLTRSHQNFYDTWARTRLERVR